MKLVTYYHSTHFGAGRITAVGSGHQVTVEYDHGASDPHLVAVHAWLRRYAADAPEGSTASEVERDARGAFPHRRYWEVAYS